MTRKRASFFTLCAAVAAFSFFLGAGGCDEFDESIDCATVCDRYRDCFDQTYDVGACEDRCENRADDIAGYENAVDACEDCIGVNSCLSQVFNCPVCANVVP
jgi:hypothetical protein